MRYNVDIYPMRQTQSQVSHYHNTHYVTHEYELLWGYFNYFLFTGGNVLQYNDGCPVFDLPT